MKNKILGIIFYALPMTLSSMAFAETLNVGFFSADFSDVGNAGNAADSLDHIGYRGSIGYGAVSYNYKIAKYETTVAQYVTFLNSVGSAVDQYGLYNPNSGILNNNGTYSAGTGRGSANKPITYVSYYDAVRYINWIANGATSNASTESGSYLISGGGPDSGVISSRNASATYVLPSENEWYKAAYNKGLLSTDYSDNPTDGRTMIGADYPNMANRYLGPDGPTGLGSTVDVGSYGSGYYGTYDMAGNVWEYSETFMGLISGIETYGIRGGAYIGYTGYDADASMRGDSYYLTASHTGQDANVGFRTALVPEPSALSLLAFGLGGLAMMRRRRS
jgi:formylglycine-generating enzyme required for sulfatase activity